jgi:ABC-type transport system involved in cytochrome bd biosynthesis fused ATPase/permease subunit
LNFLASSLAFVLTITIITMAKFSVLLSLLVVALVALTTTAFAPQPVFCKLEKKKKKKKDEKTMEFRRHSVVVCQNKARRWRLDVDAILGDVYVYYVAF